MAFTTITNLRGPEGKRGPQGIPGANSLPTDAAVAGLLGTEGDSESKTAATEIARHVADTRVTTERKAGTAPSGTFAYFLTRVHTGGRFIPGLLSKAFAFDYEKAGTSGAAFKPTPEALKDAQRRLGAPLIANGSGFRTETDPNPGEMRGAQIKDGIAYHGLSGIHWQDFAAIGYRKDGSLKSYSIFDGDSAASMIADGVVHSWSWGPALMVGGVPTMFWADPNWSTMNTTSRSARTILGQTATGDIVLIIVEGVTGTSGITSIEAAELAEDEGLYTAHLLDGGGSAQANAGGLDIVRSSDATPRPVADFVIVKATLESNVDTGWIPMPLATGFTGTAEYRRFNGGGALRASITGACPEGATVLSAGPLPPEVRPSRSAPGSVRFSGAYTGTAWVTESGNVGVSQQTGAARNNPEVYIQWLLG